jgi:NTP pyrophosphatase (non-canonical NTP hydrolase)
VAVLVAGRRSGKGVLASELVASELARRLDTHEAQAPLRFLTITHRGDEAKAVHRKQVAVALRHPICEARMANDTVSYCCFQTKEDIRRTGTWVGSQRRAAASFRLTTRSSQARGLLGSHIGFFCLDEPDAMASNQADDAWHAAEPCLHEYCGTALVVGTPVGTSSWLRRMYGDDGVMSLRIPTWEMNPGISSRWLSDVYLDDPLRFWTEFGACFVEEQRGVRPVGVPWAPEDPLVEHMRRLVRGEKDVHDRVVDAYKARVRAWPLSEPSGHPGVHKYLFDYPVGMIKNGQAVPYTPAPPSDVGSRVGGGMSLNDIGRQHCAWQDRNFDRISPLTQALALAEETGEVARAVLKTHHGIRSQDRGDVAEELADVVLVASGLAARLGIDLEAAVAAKAARRDLKDFRARPETG